jgi:hypothetical protein
MLQLPTNHVIKSGKIARIYLQEPNGILHPILWFRCSKPDEILWAPYGMHSKHCTLHSLFPDEDVDRDESSPRKYYFRDFVEVNEPIDHFSSHMDGTFHLKGRHAPPIYSNTLRMRENLGPDSPVFLEFMVNSETASEYSTKSKSRITDQTIIIIGQSGAGVQIIGAVAGSNYDIEEFVMDGLDHSWTCGYTFSIGVFKAALATRLIWPNFDLIENRPKGTLLTLRFFHESGKFRHKVFLFN